MAVQARVVRLIDDAHAAAAELADDAVGPRVVPEARIMGRRDELP